jgi:hypothetical protein
MILNNKYRLIFFLILLFSVESSFSQQPKNFKVFNGMLYKKMPDNLAGMSKIKIAYELELLSLSPTNMLDRARRFVDNNKIQSLAKNTKTAQSSIVCFDIESWDTRIKRGGDVSMRKYLQVLQQYKSINSNAKVGYFGVVPFPHDIENFYKGKRANTSLQTNWQTNNDFLKPIYNKIDIAFPIFYMSSNDRTVWESLVSAQVAMIKKYRSDVPIYGFVWPQYYNPRDNDLNYKFIDADTWLFQLETLYKYCDGVVIWGPPTDNNKKPLYWDNQASWWLATQKFMSTHNITK